MQRALLLIFLFSCLGLNAQNDYSFVPHDYWANYSAMDVRDDAIVMVGYDKQCDTPYLTLLNKNTGAELWSTNAGVMYYGLYTDVTILEDGTIWAAGVRRPSDDVSQDFQAILIHLSAQGEVLAYRAEFDDVAYEGNLSNVVALPDGTLFWSTGLSAHYLDSNGLTLQSWTFDGKVINRLGAVSSDSFAIGTDDGEVILVQTAGGQEQIQLSSNEIVDLEVTANGIYWTEGNLLGYYDFTTETVTEWTVPFGPISAIRLHLTATNVYVYTAGLNLHGLARLLPDESAVVLINSWETPDRTLIQLIEEAGTFYQLGNDVFESQTDFRPLFHGYVRKTTGLPAVEGPDIGVTGVNISVDSVNLTVNDKFYWAYVYWSGMIQVTNYSDVPVGRFLLASPAEGGFNCVEGRFFMEVDEPIEPQSSVLVPMTYTSYLPASLDEEGNATINLEFCVYSAAPNRTLDREPVNDHFCESILIVDTEDNIQAPIPLQLFPNPVSNHLTLSWPAAQIERTLLFDETGRLVLQHDWDKSSQVTLSLKNLPTGVYWLQVITKTEVITKRVVKV